MFELIPLLGREDWAKAWLQYCRLGSAPGDVLDKDRVTGNEGADAQYVEGRKAARASRPTPMRRRRIPPTRKKRSPR